MKQIVSEVADLSIGYFPKRQLAQIIVFMPVATKRVGTKTRTPLGEFLDARYLEWRDAQPGKRGPFTTWAKVIKVPRESLNNYINRGSTPDGKALETLARLYGDIVYVKARVIPPGDARLEVVVEKWGRLPNEAKKEILDIATSDGARS